MSDLPADTGGADLPRPFGNADLLRRLGRGERGDVYLGLRPEGVDRLCTIKILHGAAGANPTVVTALQAEAGTVVRRVHGNVVQIYDVGRVDDRIFFLGERVQGCDLGALLERLAARGERLPPEAAVYVAGEVAAAVGYLRGSLERAGGADAILAGGLGALTVAPGSVLLSIDGDVKLLNYGAAMSAALAPRPGQDPAPDRAALMAPELMTGAAPASPASGGGPCGDVYAIGALLWHMVIGRFLGQDDAPGHLRALRSGSFAAPSPSAHGARIPEALERLTLAALARTAALRPRTCDDLRAGLAVIGKALGGGGGAGLAALVKATFGAEIDGDRAAIGELIRTAEARRAQSSGTRPGAITLARVDAAAKQQQRIATSLGGDLAPGQVIPGTRYRTLSKIGEGGMGVVYAAEHVDLEKKVALKLLNAEMLRSPEILQQFRQEARAASKIGNPYICDVTDFGEVVDGRVFFVMEFLDGQTLGRVLRRERRVAPARGIGLLRQIAKALGAAHDKGIVHLDVKPDNVMLIQREGRSDSVKVVDFGIAGLLGKAAGDENLAGTVEYIAPERALSRGYDHRSDVYSLGAMAYEILVGSVPFQGTDALATMTMQAKDPPEPLRRRAPDAGIPAALEAVVLKMLEKDPAARQQSMADVEAELCEAQIEAGLRTPWDDLPLPAVDEARRAQLAERMPSPSGRPRKAIVYGAIGAAAIAGSLAVYFGFIREPKVVTVRVTETQTEERPSVAVILQKADQAARDRRFVSPVGDSALDHIVAAETEAARIATTSPGAARLRRMYATALGSVGDELADADLRELATVKWKEALLFDPADAELQRKAQLSTEEKKATQRMARTGVGRGGAAEKAATPADAAREAASRLYLAARDGRFSEARLARRAMAETDAGGTQSARLADGLRKLALKLWIDGKRDRARPYYELIADLDPRDAEARERASPAAAAATSGSTDTAAAPGAAGLPSLGAPALAAGGGAKIRRRELAADDLADAPRDPAASQREAQAGMAALARGRLSDAEQAFARAVRADPGNATAIGGTAEVAFERARYAEAMDYARRASRLAPRSHKHFVVLGDSYFKLLRYADALTAYEKARALAPGDSAVKGRIDRVKEKLR